MSPRRPRSLLTQLDEDRLGVVRSLAENEYERLVRWVVKDIKNTPPSARMCSEDWPLPDAWEDFKYQVQREEFMDFEVFEDMVRMTCLSAADRIDPTVRAMLWLFSPAFYKWDCSDHSMPPDEDVLAGVGEEVYQRVSSLADEEELVLDPDEERYREQIKEDIAFNSPKDETEPRSTPQKSDRPEGEKG
ncbi:MAG: hypothetical protein KF787_03190 [Phycisphaeraceae bacterium]|nr:hypothetical protein [Phycisphaerae bacterium]MBX3391633.1 hypothetical protein [Phycisphaeraceae bacterium]